MSIPFKNDADLIMPGLWLGNGKSSMNESGDKLFHSEFIRNCQFNGWFQKPTSDDLTACDFNKHYTSNLMGEDQGSTLQNLCR